ncbi:MAG: glucose-6-phosphate isomerase [Gemmatimonadota bacterium]|jgi:glucose-6-phosphate isomerase|nr:glucose-6-phosphate isomerase [Gemmatimonadota bacterium]MDP6802128.1 glucose-6-phosphate isomerase [Gemmatimonadota bacterium]MDP7032063.1 glucose-6-phosphate isomerase [Gemmatimonadota bacterium]
MSSIGWVPGLHAPESLERAIGDALRSVERADAVSRLWSRDATLWSDDPTEISNRLGWLDTMGPMAERLNEVAAVRDTLARGHCRDVVLLGMGGSSLAAEVFANAAGRVGEGARLIVLDSSSPNRIRRVESELDFARTHVLVASKSGSTIEVATLLARFRQSMAEAVGGGWAGHFTAITDSGSPLENRAREEGFAHVLTNPPDVGGRYSAMTLFGLVPWAVLGQDPRALLSGACAMAAACRKEIPAAENPGALLGAVMGGAALAGRDKLTLRFPRALESLGAWIEQLVAESTGKDGRGILPVTGEPPESVATGEDRMVVELVAPGEEAPLAEGETVFRIPLAGACDIGGEMFRWEFATAVAGFVLGVHPFDQPDVQATKRATGEILRVIESGESPPSVEESDAMDVLATLTRGDAVALTVFGDPVEPVERAMAELRAAISARWGVATTLGFGPRFLHSTGQLHKGGPDSTVVVQFLAEEDNLPIPEKSWGFGDLLAAQASGDLSALRAAGRRAVRSAGSGCVADQARALAERIAG